MFILTHFSPAKVFVIFNQATQTSIFSSKGTYLMEFQVFWHFNQILTKYLKNILNKKISIFLGKDDPQPAHMFSKSINVKSLLIITLISNALLFVLMSSSSEHLNTQHIFYIFFVVAHVFAYIFTNPFMHKDWFLLCNWMS